MSAYRVSAGETVMLEPFIDDSRGPVGGRLDMRGQARWEGGGLRASPPGVEKSAITTPIVHVLRPDGSRVLLDTEGNKLPADADKKATWDRPPYPYREEPPIAIPVSSFSVGPGTYRLRLSVVAPTYGADTPRVLLFSPKLVVEVE